jgi:hypothetical protein
LFRIPSPTVVVLYPDRLGIDLEFEVPMTFSKEPVIFLDWKQLFARTSLPSKSARMFALTCTFVASAGMVTSTPPILLNPQSNSCARTGKGTSVDRLTSAIACLGVHLAEVKEVCPSGERQW